MKKRLPMIILAAVVIGAGFYFYKQSQRSELSSDPRFASGNGRLEATEVSIATKLAGRIEKIMVDEGDFITTGQHLALMQTNVLRAQLAQAEAQRNQAEKNELSSRAQIQVRYSELEAAKATVLQKESKLEDAETASLAAKADLLQAQASVKEAEAAIEVAKAGAEASKATIQAAVADIARIQADIDDSLLVAPREGRIQYRIAQPGEVLSAGGRVLNLVDLTDVYMTFFLPEEAAGKVRIGSEVRLLLDAIPGYPVPAKVSYVASVAQFTPKTVETRSEREKLMFRVKARIAPELLKKYITLVKTGIPGVAWVKLDGDAEWPAFLQIKKLAK